MRYRAAALGLLGRTEEARQVVERLLALVPDLTIAHARRHVEVEMKNPYKKRGVAEATHRQGSLLLIVRATSGALAHVRLRSIPARLTAILCFCYWGKCNRSLNFAMSWARLDKKQNAVGLQYSLLNWLAKGYAAKLMPLIEVLYVWKNRLGLAPSQYA